MTTNVKYSYANSERLALVSEHESKRYGIDPMLMASKHYTDLVNKVLHYSKAPSINLMEMLFQMKNGVKIAYDREKEHRDELSRLALNTILNMEEFKFIRDMIQDGDLKIDAKLVDMDALDINADMDELPEKEEDPEIRFSLAEVMFDDDERKARKVLANSIAQGSALNTQYAFHLVEDELERLGCASPNVYGFVMSYATLLYYTMPDGMPPMGAEQGGQVDVAEDEEGTYVIKARGVIFPVLLQEIVKGIYQYVSLTDGLRDAEEGDVASEINDIIVGPEIANLFRKYIKEDELKYVVPAFQQMLITLDSDEIKEIFTAECDKNPLRAIIDSMKEEEEDCGRQFDS